MSAVRLLVALAVLLLFQLAGTWLVRATGFTLPGSVVGMALLAGALRSRLLPEWTVRPAADLLVRHLALLYVPAGVVAAIQLDLLRANWLAISAAALGSLVAVLVAVGTVTQRMAPAEPTPPSAPSEKPR